MFDKNYLTKLIKENMGHRIQGILCLVFTCLVACFCTGCGAEDPLDKAAELYAAGDYVNAETYFLDALRAEQRTVTVYSGYGFNELKRKDFDGAASIFKLLINAENGNPTMYQEEPKLRFDIRRGLYESYVELGETENALGIMNELIEINEDESKNSFYRAEAANTEWKLLNERIEAGTVTEEDYSTAYLLAKNSLEAGNRNIQTLEMMAALNDHFMRWDEWEENLREIIGMKTFASNEYYAIYSSYCNEKSGKEVLSLTDEIIVYMDAHSDYIESYDDLLAMTMNSAEIASYVVTDEEKKKAEKEKTVIHDDLYYFDLAEKYLETASFKGLSENQKLKYRIVIAERKGKMEVAYKLLGVYLEHCPDDEKAVKEKAYLEHRLGVKGE